VATPPATGTVVSHYRLREVLGRGAMGEVWLADDLQLPRQVAVKLLPPQSPAERGAVERLLREAQAAASVDHPAVVTVYEAGVAEDRPYVVMQKVEGETLEALLRNGPLPVERALALASQIADALSEVHALGIVHRDLKPSNIIWTARGAKLLDFGLASIHAAIDQTRTAGSIGTPVYMSPEQTRGMLADNRSDLWSLGCILYEALTGTRPFAGDALAAIAMRVLSHEPAPPSSLRPEAPRELDFIVAKLLRKDPALRYQRAEDLLADLKSLGSGAGHPPAGAGTSLPSVAVLPFEAMSADPADGYLAAGLAEDLVVDLARVKGLRVASRDEVHAYRDRSVPARTLARELGVDYVLSGSVRRAGQRARISAQLVRASDGHTLWAERFDRTLEDLFDVQAEVAKQIVAALQVAVSPREQALIEKVPTRSREAYELFLQARALMDSQYKDANTQAGQLLRAAIDLDPQFAQAIAALAECHARRVLAWWGSADDVSLARELAERATAIEPDLVEARFALATAYRYAGDPAREIPELERILALDPEHPSANEFVAWSYMSRGEPERALPILERITSLPAVRYNAISFLSMCYDMLHREADARRAEDRLFEALLEELRKRPDNVHARSLLGQRMIHHGDRAGGLAQVDMSMRLAPDDNRVLYNAACTFAVAGERKRAMELLREGVRRVPGYLRDWPRHDPDLSSLRHDPEFIEMFRPPDAKQD
jgi:TolB-like protein/cytochrome c-type biogenesis protein CcmH/NrfG